MGDFDLTAFIAGLFFVDFVLHIFQYSHLQRQKSPLTSGVLVFMIIYALLGILMLQPISWIKYVAMAIPLFGGISLIFTLKRFMLPKWINYSILIADFSIVAAIILGLMTNQ